jgi:ABC-type transport system involved in multi-copper enzyme maturation permease subunit
MKVPGRAPGPLLAVLAAFTVSIPEHLHRSSSRATLALLAWPVLLPAMSLVARAPIPSWTSVVSSYFEIVIPLAALFGASRLVRDDLELQSIVYWLCRPIPRGGIVFGKFLAWTVLAIAATCVALGTAWMLAPHPAQSSIGFVRAGLVCGASLVVYGSIFLLFGVAFRRPMLPGLLFFFIWEALALAPGRLPLLTLAVHMRNVAGVAEPSVSFPALGSWILLFMAAATGLSAAAALFSLKEHSSQA